MALALVVQACSGANAGIELPDRVDYNYHIRPILSNSCYVCHGPDVSTREAELRLDVREGATAKREGGGRAIVPGSPRRSLLIKRITNDDPDERMPPAEANKTLSKREIALLRRWIDQGAEYKRPWALIPPAAPVIPSGTAPIDHFIAKRIDDRGLYAAPPATKEALARRASYVLTGLPPPPERVKEFMEDPDPKSYEFLVDELLASPRFGERWARHWMDLVRYAESKGHEFDFTIDGAWRYRDYLIRAFNADVPYDRFVTEHLAGDLMEDPRTHPTEGYDESVIGTVYLSLGEGKHSPVDNRIDEAERIDNIIDVTTKTFQGLTLACARCHDHKFDPLPTADYYSFYGMVESTRFASTPLLSAHQQASLDSLQSIGRGLRESVAAVWERSAGSSPVQLTGDHTSLSAPEVERDSAHAWKVLGDFRSGTYDGWFPQGPAFGASSIQGIPLTRGGRISGLTAGVATSRQVAAGIPGALRSPTFVIEHDSLHVIGAGANSAIRIVVDNFQLIRHPIHGDLEVEVNSPKLRTYRFDVAMWRGRKAYVELLVGTYDKERFLTETHRLCLAGDSYIEAAYVVTFSGDPPELADLPVSTKDLRQAIRAWERGNLLAAQARALDHALELGQLPEVDVSDHLHRMDAEVEAIGEVSFVNAVTDGDRVTSPVFGRGNYRMPSGEPVPHRFFSALDKTDAPFTESASGRLDLARRIADPANPLTARVIVNRLWHHVFGRGIVKTVDNFGAQGSLPTHPELLDYLALRFIELDWSIKAMLREIVLTETFRRATLAGEDVNELDPENILLSHFPVQRLEAEAIRDAVLSVSGRLDTTMFGKPVPTHLTDFLKGRGRPEHSGPLDGAGRRSVYLAVRRNFLSPMMLAFDRPVPFSTFGARNTSNVPAQSLTMLNDPFFAEQARVWGNAIAKKQPLDTDTTIEYIYLTALSRLPTAEEVAAGRSFLEAEAERTGVDPAVRGSDAGLWAAYCHVVFNLKEFIYLV